MMFSQCNTCSMFIYHGHAGLYDIVSMGVWPTSNFVAIYWHPATMWQPTGNQQLYGNPLATSNFGATHWQPTTMWQPTGNQQLCGNQQ